MGNNSLLKPYQKTAGALLFLAGSICLGIIIAETFYPAGYSTSINKISDLGSTMPLNSVIRTWRRRALGCISNYSMANWLRRLFAGHSICNKKEYG